MTDRKAHRNSEVLCGRRSGMTLDQLAKRYHLTTEGIRGIILKEERREAFGPLGEVLSDRAFYALRRFCEIRSCDTPRDIEGLKKTLSGDWKGELLSIRHVGENTVDEIAGLAGFGMARNDTIFMLRQKGHSYVLIAKLFGLCVNRVRDISETLKRKEELAAARRASSGDLCQLSNTAFLVVCSAVNKARLDRDNPDWMRENRYWPDVLRVPISFEEFKSWIVTNPAWRQDLLRETGCGPLMLNDLETFVRRTIG